MNGLLSLARQIAVFAGVAAVAYFAETGKDGGFIRDVWNAAKTASPFAAMFAVMAWLDERRERRDAQRQCQDRTVSFVEATNKQSGAMESMVDGIKTILHELDRLLPSENKPRKSRRRRG